MPKYRIGRKTFRRKNLYIPCVIAENFDDLSEEDQVKIFKETWWADNLSDAEWRTILKQNPPNYERVVRSRLKKKIVGWLVVLGRLATFEADLYNDAVKEAKEIYSKLIKREHPLFPERGVREAFV